MASKDRAIMPAFLRCYLEILLLFLLLNPFVQSDSRIYDSQRSLKIEGPRLSCAQQNESIVLKCTFNDSQGININKSKPTVCGISWHSEGVIIAESNSEIMQNSTIIISTLTVHVDWEKHKVFTCFATCKGNVSETSRLNASLTLYTMPRQTEITGTRLIEKKDGKFLEIYWKQDKGLNYSLVYTVDDDICTDEMISDVECSYRDNNVYRVPNTKGDICKASIKTVCALIEYKMYVVTTKGQCSSNGKTQKRELSYFGKDPGPNRAELVLIPCPVSVLCVRVAMRRVELTWTTNGSANLISSRTYLLKFNCTEFDEQNKRIKVEKVTLYSKDFPNYKPYSLCQFCIQVYVGPSKHPNVYSEPLCQTTRLHEEKPSEPPKITCGKQCPATMHGRFRNVTVMWSLPPRETWNGDLTHITIIYGQRENGSRHEQIIDRNISRGLTVLKRLKGNTSYAIQMATCNKEGCSSYGNASILTTSFDQNPQKQGSTKSSNDVLPWIIGSSIVAISILLVLTLMVWQYCRKRNENRTSSETSLPNVTEPSDDYDRIAGDQKAGQEYDFLSDDVSIEKPGDVNVSPKSSDGL